MTEWVKPTREQVIGWREDGLTWRQVGIMCGVAATTVLSWVQTQNLPAEIMRPTRSKTTNAEIRVLLFDKQYSDRALATHLGITVNSAQRRRLRAGIRRDNNGKPVDA